MAAVALALLALLGAFAAGRTSSAQAQEQSGVRLDQITEDPAAFYGRMVTVAGEVDGVLSERAFSIEDDDILFDDDIIVITSRPLPAIGGRWRDGALLEDDIVLVSGTVRPFNLAEIERELGVDLDDDTFAYWTGDSAIVASSVIVTPRKPGLVSASVDEIADDLAAYSHRLVAVRGEVDDVLGQRAFTIADDDPLDDDNLLVVTARPPQALEPRLTQTPLAADNVVEVRGPVRRFNLADFEREIGADLDDDTFDGWEGRPAIIARSLDVVP
jgi:hypothetical protein